MSWFRDLNRAITDDEAPFLNFGWVAEGDARRRSPTATSVALVRRVVDGIDLAGRTVLDVGCGRGGTLRWLRRHAGADWALGLDREPTSVAVAHGRSAAPGIVGDALALPLRTGSTDVVVNVESSCLYDDLGRFYAEVARVLRPGGWVAYADVLTPEVADALPAAWAAAGLAIDRQDDVTANVRASIALRMADSAEHDVLAWFHDRLGSDLGYWCVQGHRVAPSGPAVGLPQAGLHALVAEVLARAQPSAG